MTGERNEIKRKLITTKRTGDDFGVDGVMKGAE